MSRVIIITSFLSVIAAAIGLWAYSRKHPTKILPVDELLNHVLHTRPTRVALVLVWWWLGWHYLAAR